ncbi:Arabidopsis thaliana lipoxygenase 5 [Hibiscus trionum]|uniref:Lipoxygenase n=1 Tax=Hibiscus trionum TaxID=183268 RepID=A0A9W7MQA7_HIBTR|nr:Arabidopsis thaliana lipoxygenase 5 [Hibiscus trionum]
MEDLRAAMAKPKGAATVELNGNKPKTINGRVVLMKKNLTDVTDPAASLLDRVRELIHHRVSLQLVSATHVDFANWKRGKLSMPAYLEDWVATLIPITAKEATYSIAFEWDAETMGVPGAFIIRNHHHSQFYLKNVTLYDDHGSPWVHFDCNSWVYPTNRYTYNRIFFSNKSYLPSDTPEALRDYRMEELENLRGNGQKGELKEWDRVYDYAYYNDLGSPEKGPEHARPVLGGSAKYPYPRRGKTGRAPNKKDPNTESRLSGLDIVLLNIYVPRDERFSTVKFWDFLAYFLKAVSQTLGTAIDDRNILSFNSLQDVLDLYEGHIKLPNNDTLKGIRNAIPWTLVKELLRNDGEKFMKFPIPAVIKEDKNAWRTDEEFARETLAGLNPVIISRLREFPPTSKLDPEEYGNQHSSIIKEDIEKNMNGFSVKEALDDNRLFILDHHDGLMTYLRRINSTSTKTYATRTLFFLQDDGTLKPLAIELSLPHPQGDKHGSVSKVFTPEEGGIGKSIWQLAKAYAGVNDSGYHQLISHWLNTHAVIEPFIIASNRQLSVLHPIYKLLHPHFRDTMNINALARMLLISANGVVELTVYPRNYALEMSSAIYKSWDFTEQALPADLLKRGMAVKDSRSPNGISLVIKDYPFAVDGLEIWSAIETWVTQYCSIYYPSDEAVQKDNELQSWWEEIRNEGHGDLKDKPWWPEMSTKHDLIQACTTLIWMASALHASVNFGQYPYAGYIPNRPTVSRRFMPESGTKEYAELENNPDLAFLKTITPQDQTMIGVSLIEILSRHSADEIYLGQRDTPEWTSDEKALAASERFRDRLIEIEKNIVTRNNDGSLKNRTGPVKVPYTLLYPNTSDYSREGGLTGMGVPNSISI